MHVRQPEVTTRVAISQFSMVDPHQMQDRGVVVVYVAGVGGDFRSEFVRFAVTDAPLHTAANQEAAEGFSVVVATFGPDFVGQGVRPNSVQIAISVSSSRPRCLRS